VHDTRANKNQIKNFLKNNKIVFNKYIFIKKYTEFKTANNILKLHLIKSLY